MRAALDNLALVEDNDLIRCGDRRQTMAVGGVSKRKFFRGVYKVGVNSRNRDGSSSGSHALQGILDLSLSVRVQGCGSLVQQQDTGVLQNSSCDGNLGHVRVMYPALWGGVYVLSGVHLQTTSDRAHQPWSHTHRGN